MSAKKQVEKEIMEAYLFLREKNMSIPSETLDFMKDAAIEKLNQVKNNGALGGCFPTEEEIIKEAEYRQMEGADLHSWAGGARWAIGMVKK